MRSLYLALIILIASFSSACSAGANISLQVLGSGGPIADDARASSGYVLRIDGVGRLMIDAGGGTFQRFGEAGFKTDDLSFIGLTHFHTDHSSEIPAFMKSAWFGDRTSPMTIAGPAGGGDFPGLNDWLAALFAPGKGAFAYLSGYIDGDANPFALKPVEVSLEKGKITPVVAFESYQVSAIPVPHGPVPSLAYKIKVGGLTLVISGDQNLSDASFVDFVRGADLWVMPFVIPENAGRIGKYLHAVPSKIGEVAARAEVKTLLLSHFMARSLANLDENVALVKKTYKGKILLAEDLQQLDYQPTQKTWAIKANNK